MDIKPLIGSVNDILLRISEAEKLDDARQWAHEGLQRVNVYLKEGEGAIDPWLVKWAESKWSLPIAVGFGVALLTIGDIINAAHLLFGLMKFIF